ncbi:MAG TPA: hypothetical protein PLP49_06650 [Anaerohalosphaeraceae bacterium]|jgi:hypothetical protein|nr:hypothetical protein [Anaerohalosphaeraceae bacterium]HPB92149.1 hypothetical protein [Anaerohalosphaeraceae bacterium]HRT22621.1 hypothetical protein [Anaerohalosphaeraceae bacterium]HRU14476.1 hypothetical protein [Anaerohalosphaeraceae bacterium]
MEHTLEEKRIACKDEGEMKSDSMKRQKKKNIEKTFLTEPKPSDISIDER